MTIAVGFHTVHRTVSNSATPATSVDSVCGIASGTGLAL